MINVAKIKELELAIMMIEFVPNYFATPRITLAATPTDLQWKDLIVEGKVIKLNKDWGGNSASNGPNDLKFFMEGTLERLF